jgi:hypothetical protein
VPASDRARPHATEVNRTTIMSDLLIRRIGRVVLALVLPSVGDVAGPGPAGLSSITRIREDNPPIINAAIVIVI